MNALKKILIATVKVCVDVTLISLKSIILICAAMAGGRRF